MKIELLEGDCLIEMGKIPNGCIDLIFCDLPYGKTNAHWDSIIPLDKLWKQYKRVLKPNGIVVLTGTEPFTSMLVVSNIDWFRCDWVWKKERGSGHLNAKRYPLRSHENVLVFSQYPPRYQPIMRAGMPYYRDSGPGSKMYNEQEKVITTSKGGRYPLTVVEFPAVAKPIHVSQKPEELVSYFLRTYGFDGCLVLDNAMGSGTTGVVCSQLNYNFIGIELDKEIFEGAKARIEKEGQL